jgi:hypothetical protein
MAGQVAPVYKYLLPIDDLTLADTRKLRHDAVMAGIARAVATRAIPSAEEALIRDADPVTDFGMAAGGWLTAALAVVGTQYSVMNALTPTLANNRVAVFYGVWLEAIPVAANLLSFREGAAAGSTYAMFNLEQLTARQQLAGYFSEPVTYDPQRVMNIVVTARVVAAAQRIGLMCFIIEPRGPVVSA